MSTHRKHDPSPGAGGPAEHRLARLLDAPFLARVVPHLAPETLHQLIRSRGLEACGALVTSATPAQLTAVLDLDLWRPAQRRSVGNSDEFDADRFGEWLEVLIETGESLAGDTVAALDPHLVIAGLSRYLRVFDPGTFEPTAESDDEPFDRHQMMNSERSDGAFECELGGYLVRARRTDAWDAIVALLVTLETEHHECFHAVMRGCRSLSNSRPEIDGLDDLAQAPEQHLHDVALERERRRSQLGYASTADARAFLQMARQRPAATAARANAIAAAYFREAEEGPAQAAPEPPPACAPPPEHAGVIELLTEAGLMPEQPRALLGAAGEEAAATRVPLLRRQMEFLLHYDATAYLTRGRELAFLANTLLAGASLHSRPFTPAEASDAAACVCNLGLDCLAATGTVATGLADRFLVEHDLVATFEVGWSALYRDVSLFVADQLISVLADLDCLDADVRHEMRSLRRTLVKERERGTPWLARGAAEVLALLDTTASIGVAGLLDECPIVPAALVAVIERRTTPVSPTAFDFIATRAQIGDIRVFMRTLRDVLSG